MMGRHRSSNSSWRLLLAFAFWVAVTVADEMRDVAEGDDVILECRFNYKLVSPGRASLYWSRANTRDKDNVAIGETPLEQNYEIDYRPAEGRYDLRIHNATYDRDNGKYECHAKESGSGKKLHSATIQLTVLLPPGIPKIVPVEPSATEGRTFELTCSSYGGSPDPLIKWYRSDMAQPMDSIIRLGGSRKNKTSAILSVTPTREDDSTEYRCVVWNRALADGVQLQSSVVLNVNYFPRVRVGPENPLRIEKGGSAKLSCHVDAKPAVSSVRWTRNGKFSETTFGYVIPRVSLSDAGTYVCSADNGLGQTGEADVTLDVLYAPIVSVVARKEYEEGENVWIKCNVSSNPRPATVEWIKKDDLSFRQSGDLLRIERASAANVGDYICRATNVLHPSGAEASYERSGNATVTLLIKHAPGKTTIEPSQPYVVEGAGVTLSCGSDPPGWPLPQYRWWREGSEATIAVGAQLNIGSAKASTEGTYFCQPNNEIGTGTVGHVQLQVHHAPRISTGLQAQVIRRTGDTGFSVMCSAVGKPRPNITWVKDGQAIDSVEGSLYKVVTEDIVGAKGFYTVQSTLYFSGDARDSILATDRGYYACVFENDVRKEESHMYLRVQHKPIFIRSLPTEPERVAFDVGDTAFVPCHVQAYPKPEFDWSFNTAAAAASAGLDPGNYDTNLTILSNERYVSTLIIRGMREEHYGPYTCHTYNSMGNMSAVVLLEKRGKPWPPTGLHVTGTGTSSVALGFEPGFDGGYANTKYMVSFYSDKQSRLQDFDCQAANPCNVTGLEQQTIYVFKAKAYNDRGYSEYSPSVTNMTRVDVARIPTPVDVKYEPQSGTVVFGIVSASGSSAAAGLPLKAKLEAQGLDGGWRLVDGLLPFSDSSFRHVIEAARYQNVEGVRASLCVGTEDMCGGPVIARQVQAHDLPATAQPGVRVHYVIGGIVSAIVLLLCLVLAFIFCCCRRGRKKTVKKVEYEAGRGHQTQVIPPPYFTTNGGVGMENKAMDRSVDIIEDAMKTFQQNGYLGNGNGDAVGGIPYIDQNSYSNSNNGGSVDSQDSLWKITNGSGSGSGEHHQHILQQQQYGGGYQHQMNPNGNGNYDPYPPSAQLLLQQQQQQHQQYEQQQQYLSPYDNRATSAMYLQQQQQDPYGVVPKPKRRQDLMGDPYLTELSGLPDPSYHNHSQNMNGHMTMDQNSLLSQDDSSANSTRPLHNHNHNQQHLQQSYDDAAVDTAGGYATPNSRGRRVIREIIV